MHYPVCSAAVALLLFATAPSFASNDTVHVRGPNYDGVDTTSEITLPWPETGPTVLWRRPIGQGYSGFVIHGGKAYTQIQRREGQRLVCLDLHTGETLWETRYNWPWHMDNEWPGPYATPTYSDGHVFFAGALGIVGCADANSGDLIWTRNVLKEFDPRGVTFGYASTPLVMSGKVYLPLGGESSAVIALHAQSGKIAWQSGSDEGSYSPSIPVVTGTSTQIVSYLATVTVANDPHSGRELWRQEWGSGYSPHGTWPLYQEPYLFRTHPFKRGCRVDRIVESNSVFALEPVWKNKAICADFLSPVLTETAIFGFDVRTPQADRDGRTRGSLVCLDLETGTTLWRTNAVAHASVQVCDGKLLIMDEKGFLIVAEINRESYAELARYPILPGAVCWTMPTISRNYLIARNQEDAVCIYLGPSAPICASKTPADYVKQHWLDGLNSETTWMPKWRNLATWYAVCLLGILLPSWTVRKIHPACFFATSMILGLAGTQYLSMAMERFFFTWPVVLFALLLWIQTYAVTAMKSRAVKELVLARLLLALFAAACLLFWCVCGHLYLLGGWGFLTGFLPAIPLMQLSAKRLSEKKWNGVSLVSILLAFSV